MGLLGILLRGAKDTAEEQLAKRRLEQKLGRKVSKEEVYSLSSHMDAAGDINPAQPLISSHRESSVPFADAKPPMSFKTKLILVGVVLLGVFLFAASFLVNMMRSEISEYFNPPPAAPAGVYPETIGEYTLTKRPSYLTPGSSDPATRYSGEYKRGAETVQYRVAIYNSEADATAAYKKIKDGSHDGERSKVVERSDNRVAIASLDGWNSYVYLKDGNYVKTIDSYNQKSGLDFEGFLKNQPPLAAVALNEYELKKNASTSSNTNSSTSSLSTNGTMSVTELLNSYNKEAPSDNGRLEGKFIKLKGIVETSGRDKKEDKWLLGFMRPGSTSPTVGMVVASFDKSKEYDVALVKKGDEVTLRCKVSSKIYTSVIIEECSKLPN